MPDLCSWMPDHCCLQLCLLGDTGPAERTRLLARRPWLPGMGNAGSQLSAHCSPSSQGNLLCAASVVAREGEPRQGTSPKPFLTSSEFFLTRRSSGWSPTVSSPPQLGFGRMGIGQELSAPGRGFALHPSSAPHRELIMTFQNTFCPQRAPRCTAASAFARLLQCLISLSLRLSCAPFSLAHYKT